MGCRALLQGIFPIQGLNPGLPHCRQILYHLSPQGSWCNLRLHFTKSKSRRWKKSVSETTANQLLRPFNLKGTARKRNQLVAFSHWSKLTPMNRAPRTGPRRAPAPALPPGPVSPQPASLGVSSRWRAQAGPRGSTQSLPLQMSRRGEKAAPGPLQHESVRRERPTDAFQTTQFYSELR